jgi:UDP-GlcNAc:undecaprenyl-phosphate GlcNAc-1-phosphate transferase
MVAGAGFAWAAPGLAAALVALLAGVVARAVALRVRFVDLPGPRKAHASPTPYLGGAALALGFLVGALIGARVAGEGVLVLAAVVVGLLGLLDDRSGLAPRTKLAVELPAAALAAAAGVEVRRLGPVGALLGVLVLVGGANALNLLDNADGLGAGVTATGAAAVASLASLSGRAGLAAEAGALAGACVGFLVLNWRPAAIFLGDAGSLFCGFLLAALALDAGRGYAGPERLGIPALLLALPAADTATVVVTRRLGGRPVLAGGTDHLSHRLAAAGLGRGRAVDLLVGVEAGMAGLAVALGRGLLPVPTTAALAAVLLATVLLAAARHSTRRAPAER